MSLFAELKRRNVFKVALMYGVVGWLLAQVLQFASETFAAPDWVLKMFVVVLLLGFPVALIISWIYELTPEGIKKESEIDRSASIVPQTGQRMNTIIIATLVLAVGLLLTDRFNSMPDTQMATDSPPAAQVSAPVSGNAEANAKSVAVLPFVNMSGDQENEYFSDGLSETLLHMLAQIKDLQVAARTSAFKFKGQNEDVRIIGEQLGVANVLEGSVQRSGDRIRITAQLINVDNGFHLWSETYDRTLDDVFQVQDDIATSVAEAMQITLLGKPVNSVAGGGVDNYDQLLKAKAAIARGSSIDFDRALEILNRVIEANPNYAPAYASLAAVYNGQSFSGDAKIPEQTASLAVRAAQKAVELDPSLSEGYSELGRAFASGDSANEDMAFAAINKAYELAPGNAESLLNRALVLTRQGQWDEGLELLHDALRLDPLNTQTKVQMAMSLDGAGKEEEAEQTYLTALSGDPDNTQLLFSVARFYYNRGQLVAADRHYQRLIEITPDHVSGLQYLFYLYFDLGDFESALAYLEKGERVSPERLTDERAIYCFVLRDEPCIRTVTERMIAERDAPFVASWKARLEFNDGEPDAALTTIEKMLAQARATNARNWIVDGLQHLALAYGLNGDRENRDRVFVELLAYLSEINADGSAPLAFAGGYAAIGNAAKSAEYLMQAFDNGFRRVYEIKGYWLFDPVRESPEIKAVIERIEDDNARMLAEIRAH
jgi:TolB-like protein/Flp pilus assembly protein TadD